MGSLVVGTSTPIGSTNYQGLSPTQPVETESCQPVWQPAEKLQHIFKY